MIRIILAIVAILSIGGFFMARHSQASKNMTPMLDLNTWKARYYGPGAVTMTIDQGALKITTFNVDTGTPDQYVYSAGVTLIPGHRYHVAFQAKADTTRKINVTANTGGYAGKYDPIGLDANFTVEKDWNTFESTFTARGPFGPGVRVPLFYVGDAVGSLWVKDVVVEEMN